MTNLSLFNKNIKKTQKQLENLLELKKNANELNRIFQIPILKARTRSGINNIKFIYDLLLILLRYLSIYSDKHSQLYILFIYLLSTDVK